VPYRLYIVILTGAALLWSYGMLVIGLVLGDHWWDAVMFFRHNVRFGIGIAVGLGAIGLMVLFWQRRIAYVRAQHWPETVLPPPPPRLLKAPPIHLHAKARELSANDEAIS
jgi:hypothetical protein